LYALLLRLKKFYQILKGKKNRGGVVIRMDADQITIF
jgi:hypothetical protein